jgi:hypothetical protein
MTNEDHRDLLNILLNEYKGKWMLSGYNSELYNSMLSNKTNRVEFHTACHAAGRTRTSKLQGKGSALKHSPRTEVIWVNYDLNEKISLF